MAPNWLQRCWARMMRPRTGAPAGSPGSAGRAADAGRRVRPPVGRDLADYRAAKLRQLYPQLSSWQAQPAYDLELRAAWDELSQAVDLDDLARRTHRLQAQRTGAAVLPVFSPMTGIAMASRAAEQGAPALSAS
jgi:hypothetical protein